MVFRPRGLLVGFLVASCAGGPAGPTSVKDVMPQTPTDVALASIAPTRMSKTDAQKQIQLAIESHFAAHRDARAAT